MCMYQYRLNQSAVTKCYEKPRFIIMNNIVKWTSEQSEEQEK